MDLVEAEPSLIAYARLHGLAIDHTSSANDDSLIAQSVLSSLWADLDDLGSSHKLGEQQDWSSREKLSLDAESRRLLTSIIAARDAHSYDEADMDPYTYKKSLKLELPVLMTDPELDVKIAQRRNVMIESLPSIPLWHIDEENDEGLLWPKKTVTLAKHYTDLCEHEKLQISQQAAVLLQSVFNVDNGAVCELSEHAPSYVKTYPIDITPPLSPITPPQETTSSPVLDSQAATFVQQLPSPMQAHINPVQALQGRVFNSNCPDLSTNANLEWESAPMNSEELEHLIRYSNDDDNSNNGTLSSSPLGHKASGIKIEESFTPSTTDQAVSHISKSDNKQHTTPNSPCSPQAPDSITDEDLEDCFNALVRSDAVRIDHAVEHETSQEVDSTGKVPVPQLDFSRKPPPWERTSPSAQDEEEIREITLLIAKLKCHYWSVSKIEKSLSWVPIMQLPGDIVLHDTIEYEGLVERYTNCPTQADVADIDSLTWKPEGLRITDESDDEENELEPSSFEKPQDLEGFIEERKRKLATDVTADTAHRHGNHQPARSSPSWPNFKLDQDRAAKIMQADQMNLNLPSFTDQLDHFMDLQSGEMKRRKLSHFSPTPDILSLGTSIHTAEEADEVKALDTTMPLPSPSIEPLPLPQILPTTRSSHMIVAASVLSERRQLIKHMIRICPSLEFISRGPLSNTTKPVLTSPMADFIISPGTGILHTTLQGLRQRPLPGQTDQSLIRQRITSVAPQFEKLFVLVSSNRQASEDSSTALGENDCSLLTDLVNFAATLEDEVVVVFVGGGEEEAASWIIGLWGARPVLLEEVKLLQDETMWEHFLRKAGMNAFDAQAVLSELKEPPDAGGDGHVSIAPPGVHGLAAFVGMTAEERLTRFEGLLGGRKVLRRIGELFDAPWGEVGRVDGR